MQTYIKEFIRREKGGQPIGIAVAKKLDNGKVGLGFSICNPVDRFDKAKGEMIALGRAECEHMSLPLSDEYITLIDARFESLRRRAVKYFKVSEDQVS